MKFSLRLGIDFEMDEQAAMEGLGKAMLESIPFPEIDGMEIAKAFFSPAEDLGLYNAAFPKEKAGKAKAKAKNKAKKSRKSEAN